MEAENSSGKRVNLVEVQGRELCTYLTQISILLHVGTIQHDPILKIIQSTHLSEGDTLRTDLVVVEFQLVQPEPETRKMSHQGLLWHWKRLKQHSGRTLGALIPTKHQRGRNIFTNVLLQRRPRETWFHPK